MKIKVEIVDEEHASILTKYISIESYKHAKEHHVNSSILEEMADSMINEIKWELENLKHKK